MHEVRRIDLVLDQEWRTVLTAGDPPAQPTGPFEARTDMPAEPDALVTVRDTATGRCTLVRYRAVDAVPLA